MAGGVIDRTWSQRKARIAKILARKAKKLLQTADWPDEDLAEMGWMLRTVIMKAQIDADIVRRRLSYLRDGWWPPEVPQELQIKVDPIEMNDEWYNDTIMWQENIRKLAT